MKANISAILVIASFLVLTSCGIPNSQLNDLSIEHNSLITDYNVLSEKYDHLVSDYNALQTEIRSNYNILQNKFNELAKELEKAIIPPFVLTKGRTIQLAFKQLDDNIKYWEWEANGVEGATLLGSFMRTLDLPSMNYLKLTDVAARFRTGSKTILLNSEMVSDFRPYIYSSIFKSVAPDFYMLHNDDASRIKEVWNMVTQLCEYVSDPSLETPRLPTETLVFGGGDCEDLAILTASILKAMAPQWKISLVYMDAESPAACKTLNHVSVHVDTGSYKTFVESTSKNVMAPWSTIDGYFIELWPNT